MPRHNTPHRTVQRPKCEHHGCTDQATFYARLTPVHGGHWSYRCHAHTQHADKAYGI